MELCPDFGNFLGKIVKTAGKLDLTHSLRFARVARARRVRDNYHTPGLSNTVRERERPGHGSSAAPGNPGAAAESLVRGNNRYAVVTPRRGRGNREPHQAERPGSGR